MVDFLLAYYTALDFRVCSEGVAIFLFPTEAKVSKTTG